MPVISVPRDSNLPQSDISIAYSISDTTQSSSLPSLLLAPVKIDLISNLNMNVTTIRLISRIILPEVQSLIDAFVNHFDLQLVNVPGLEDCASYSCMKSYFNKRTNFMILYYKNLSWFK